jgi:ketosteroid isomerase-like protein
MSIAVLLSVGIGNARPQADGDVAVTAANNAFYTAISALDAVAMEKVWSQEAYVASIGPRSKAVAVGSAAVQDSYKNVMATLAQFMAKPLDTQVHVNGNVAWTAGRKIGEAKLTDGTSRVTTNFVTDVFEKKYRRWLLVSHPAQLAPQ